MADNKQMVQVNNALARIEAKLDHILGDDVDKVDLPEEKKYSGAAPYPLRAEVPISTLELPESETSEEMQVDAPNLKDKSTLPLPETTTGEMREAEPVKLKKAADPRTELEAQPRGGEPLPGYDQMTVGEVLKEAKATDEQGRQRMLTYEREHKNRVQVVDSLVNWNS